MSRIKLLEQYLNVRAEIPWWMSAHLANEIWLFDRGMNTETELSLSLKRYNHSSSLQLGLAE